jgi:hypothetical protein
MAALTPSLKQPPTGFRCFSEFASLGLQSRRYARLHRLRAVTVSYAEKYSRPPLRPPCNGKKLRNRNTRNLVGPTIPLPSFPVPTCRGPDTSGVSRLPPAFSKMSEHPTFTPHFQALTSGHVVRIRPGCPDTRRSKNRKCPPVSLPIGGACQGDTETCASSPTRFAEPAAATKDGLTTRTKGV